MQKHATNMQCAVQVRDELTYQMQPMSVRSVVLDESRKPLAAPQCSGSVIQLPTLDISSGHVVIIKWYEFNAGVAMYILNIDWTPVHYKSAHSTQVSDQYPFGL